MNTTILDSIKSARITTADILLKLNYIEAAFVPLVSQFSESVDINPFGGSVWINLSTREDLIVALKLAPQWTKASGGSALEYNAIVDEVEYKIRAVDEALPPTCRVVEEEYEEPARAAYKSTRKVVKCNSVAADLLSPARSLVEITK